ncbi:hypothetical protein LCGC14_1518960 [marine sediment metagenome]|uniref:Uncharacterized protein n=1 Tax=marine sediment metagenome TaxID=412755 RepID=A0A0F9IZE5_9ZZZZ
MNDAGFENKLPTEPGEYLYIMPGWKSPTQVTVSERMSGLVVEFIKDPKSFPTRMIDIPATAMWKKV